MYILEPIIHETIWGGDKLYRYVGKTDKKIGHLYLVSGHENLTNKVLSSDSHHQTLKELFESNKLKWGMEQYDEFPLTIALVDASNDLSIQVHPNDELAFELEGEKIGKLESWLFLNAPKNGWIYGGCECDSVEELKEAINLGNMRNVTSRYDVCKGDCVTVEAGTLHSMTNGSLVYEIEYGSNYTYRFYDFDRRDNEGKTRELHINKAIRAIDISKCPNKVYMNEGQWNSNKNYEICYTHIVDRYINRSSRLECIAVIEGNILVEGCRVNAGRGIILLPGEELIGEDQKNTVVIARLTK